MGGGWRRFGLDNGFTNGAPYPGGAVRKALRGGGRVLFGISG